MAFLPPSSDPIFRNHDDDNPQAAGFAEFMVMRRSSMSMSYSDDEGSEDGSHMVGEKKRRLNLEQVKALERSFESGNKLEPERKMQLARALGLQPRQIAIWFQNRRARWKTKQLERDHDLLKRQFDALKADNDALISHNKNLQSQLLALKAARDSAGPINLNKDSEQGSENSGGEVNLNTASTAATTTLHPNHHHHHHQRHDYDNNEHQIMKNGVAFSSSMGPASTDTSLTQLLHSSSRTACHHHHHRHHLQQQQHEAPVLNDCFCSVMFGGIDESPEFWPWPEQQNFQ